MKFLFIILSCFLGCICLGLGCLFQFFSVRPGLSVSRFARRPVLLGMLLGSVCLLWSAYHGAEMLEGDLSGYRPLVWALVPVTIVLSYFYLDYLNARALGGFFTLCANHLITGSFVYDVPGRGFYGLVCLALGVLGMVGIGLPWRYRDLLSLSAGHVRVRSVLSSAFFIVGIVLVVMPWFARL